MTVPPCTKPALLASMGPIHRTSTDSESAGVRASMWRMVRCRHARTQWTLQHGREVQDLQDARQGRGSAGDARLLLRAAAAAPAERQEGHRRGGDLEEAPAAAERQARAAGRQARHA